MILTSNQSFGSWGEVFGDRVIATAILDRILHHAITLNIRGKSYRLKDKLKAGLVQPRRGHDVNPGGGEFSMPTPGEIWMPVDTPGARAWPLSRRRRGQGSPPPDPRRSRPPAAPPSSRPPGRAFRRIRPPSPPTPLPARTARLVRCFRFLERGTRGAMGEEAAKRA